MQILLASRSQTSRFVTFEPQLLILICFIKKTSKNVIVTPIRFDIHCGFRQISTMNGFSCFFVFCMVDSLYMLWCQRFGLAFMNNCSPSRCLQNGVRMYGLDRTKTAISACPKRNAFSNVFNTSCQTEKM